MFVEDRADLERKPISCVLSCTDNVWLDSKFKPGGGFFWVFFFFFLWLIWMPEGVSMLKLEPSLEPNFHSVANKGLRDVL